MGFPEETAQAIRDLDEHWDGSGYLEGEEIPLLARISCLAQTVEVFYTTFGPARAAPNHHERLDGTGYHRGVTDVRLDLPSRVLAVADVYDALTQDRPYRPAMPMEKVLGILKKESWQQAVPHERGGSGRAGLEGRPL